MSHHVPSALPSPQTPALGLVEDIRRVFGTARRGWPIVVVALLTCLTIAGIYLARKTTVYQATSRLLVLDQSKSPLGLAGGDGGHVSEDHLPTEALILRSPLVVGRALESLDRAGLSVREVINRLTVTRPDPHAKVLQVGYLSGDRDDSIEVLRAILASYEEFLDEHYHKQNDDVTDLLKKARDELNQELQNLEAKYLDLLQEAPAQASDELGRSSQARRIEQWDRAASETKLKAVALRNQLALGRKLADEGASSWAIVQAIGQLGSGIAPGAISEGHGDSDTALRSRLVEELTDLELRHASAERLIASLDRNAMSGQGNRAVDENELARRFAADPEVVNLQDQLRYAKGQLAAHRRIARNPNDPAARHTARRINAIQEELDRLWTELRPILMEQVGQDESGRAEARKAEMELATVKAREQTLREKLSQLDAESLKRLESRENELSERLGPQDAQVLAVRDQIAALRDGGSSLPLHHETGATYGLLNAIERSLSSVEAMQTEIQQRFTEDMEESKQFQIDRLAMSNVRSNLERHRSLFNTVVDQLKQVQLTSDFNGITAQVVDPPSVSPVRPNVSLVIAVAIAVGLGLGVCTATLTEQLNPRLYSVEEIRQAVGLTALGLIPRLPDSRQSAPGSLGLVGHLMPRSPLAEGFRVVRTNLDLRRRDRPHQVILVTSPQPGDGKTTTASNLAISLAQAGRKVLLIDADLRRPMLDKVHGLEPESGLGQVLEGLVPIHQAVQATAVAGLDLITAGPNVQNPAELLAASRLTEILDAARQAYDAVILDSPPLLAVADATILGGLVDGILLVVRAGTLQRQAATRSVELLDSIGTPTLGAVINGTNHREGSYGYNAYVSQRLDAGDAGLAGRRTDSTALMVSVPRLKRRTKAADHED